ncbi:MAG: hypothetical protein Q9169_000147 [Polycauliona sp. 2 TL-2023]
MGPPLPCLDLLGLPNEILLRIIEHETRHKDFENFTLSCRTIFDLAKLARSKHLERKSKFSTFTVGDVHLYNGFDEPIVPSHVHPVLALREILADKDTAIDYCQTLKIGGVTHAGYVTGQYEDDVTEQAVSITQDLVPQLKVFAEQEPFEDSGDLIERQLEGAYDIPYAVPLVLLHNITVLELVNCSEFLQRLDGDVWHDHVVLAGIQDSHHRLQEIKLFGNHDEGGEELEVLASFVDIPSVRRLHGLHVAADSNPSNGCLFARISHITEIHFECSSIDSFYFEKLLGCVEALENFYYEHNRSISDMNLHYGRSIICALQEHARATLQTLTYVDSSPETAAHEECASCHLPSLHDFSALRHVAIEYAILQHEHTVECDEDDSVKMYRLVDVMPPTLETLELYGRMSKPEVDFMFDALRERRKEHLPKLHKISMQRDFDLDQSIQDDCKSLEIELAVVEHANKMYPHQDY